MRSARNASLNAALAEIRQRWGSQALQKLGEEAGAGHHLLPGGERLGRGLAAHLGVGVVATNNVHYAAREGHRLQDVLVAIRHNTPLSRAAHLRRPNSEYYLKPARQLAPLFACCGRILVGLASMQVTCGLSGVTLVNGLP